jgi:hypothetical protein
MGSEVAICPVSDVDWVRQTAERLVAVEGGGRGILFKATDSTVWLIPTLEVGKTVENVVCFARCQIELALLDAMTRGASDGKPAT